MKMVFWLYNSKTMGKFISVLIITIIISVQDLRIPCLVCEQFFHRKETVRPIFDTSIIKIVGALYF